MKKTYMKPQVDAVLMAAEQTLMAGSAIEVGIWSDEQKNEDALSRELGLDLGL